MGYIGGFRALDHAGRRVLLDSASICLTMVVATDSCCDWVVFASCIEYIFHDTEWSDGPPDAAPRETAGAPASDETNEGRGYIGSDTSVIGDDGRATGELAPTTDIRVTGTWPTKCSMQRVGLSFAHMCSDI